MLGSWLPVRGVNSQINYSTSLSAKGEQNMEKDKLVLKNGIEVELEAGASLSELKAAADSKRFMLATWELMTPDNLSMVHIKNSAGLTVGTYTDLVLASETSTERKYPYNLLFTRENGRRTALRAYKGIRRDNGYTDNRSVDGR